MSASEQQDETEIDAEAPDESAVEQSASGTPQPPKRRGRPPGSPKTGGRQALPKTPADLRAFITAEIGKAEHLLEIATGAEIRMSGPTGKSFLGRASIADRLAAWRMLLAKVMPDLQAVSIDAKVDGEIRTPDASPTRDVARAILGILSTANMEKIPHRGPYVDADNDDTEDAAPGAPSGARDGEGDGCHTSSSPSQDDELAACGSSAPGDFPGAGGGGSRHASAPPPSKDPSTMTQAELKAELIRQGILQADEPTHIPHNPNAGKGEQPPAMTAEAKARERLREQNNRHRDMCGVTRVADDGWMAEIAGVPDGEHEQRPGSAESDFEKSGLAKRHYVGNHGHHFIYNGVQNGDGRRRYMLFDEHGMRFGLAWGHDEAKQKIDEVVSRLAPSAPAEAPPPTKWQRS